MPVEIDIVLSGKGGLTENHLKVVRVFRVKIMEEKDIDMTVLGSLLAGRTGMMDGWSGKILLVAMVIVLAAGAIDLLHPPCLLGPLLMQDLFLRGWVGGPLIRLLLHLLGTSLPRPLLQFGHLGPLLGLQVPDMVGNLIREMNHFVKLESPLTTASASIIMGDFVKNLKVIMLCQECRRHHLVLVG